MELEIPNELENAD